MKTFMSRSQEKKRLNRLGLS